MCKLLEVNERSLFAAEEKAMKFSNRMRAAEALLILSVGGLLLLYEGNPSGMLAFAQTAESQSQAAEAKEVPIDEYSRSAQVYYMQRMGKGGWERGQEIYYQKCWICHNDYTIKEEPTGAPTLRDLYKRPKLRSGPPVNDQTVTAQRKLQCRLIGQTHSDEHSSRQQRVGKHLFIAALHFILSEDTRLFKQFNQLGRDDFWSFGLICLCADTSCWLICGTICSLD